MVWIVDDWEDFEAKAGGGRGLGTYQVRDTADGKEVRVRCGKLGYIHKCVTDEEKTYQRILEWVAHEGYLLIKETVPDEVFHL